MLTGNPVYDVAGSIGISILFVVIAIFVEFEVKALDDEKA